MHWLLLYQTSNTKEAHNIQQFHKRVITRVSTAADRPAQRRGSAHAQYSVSHHMVIKPFLLLGLAAEYRSQW